MKTADLNHQGRRLSSGARAAPSRFGGGVALVMLALLALIPAFGQDLSEGSRPRGFERAVFDLDRFAEQSDVIVRGIVSSKEPKWVGRVIYTHYDLVVQETIHGQAQSSITVAVLGGAVGNIQLAVPGDTRPETSATKSSFRSIFRRSAELQARRARGRYCLGHSRKRWQRGVYCSAERKARRPRRFLG